MDLTWTIYFFIKDETVSMCKKTAWDLESVLWSCYCVREYMRIAVIFRNCDSFQIFSGYFFQITNWYKRLDMALSLLLRSSSRLPGKEKLQNTCKHLRFKAVQWLRNFRLLTFFKHFYNNNLFSILALVNASRISCVSAAHSPLLSSQPSFNVSFQVQACNVYLTVFIFRTFARSQFHQFVNRLREIMSLCGKLKDCCRSECWELCL